MCETINRLQVAVGKQQEPFHKRDMIPEVSQINAATMACDVAILVLVLVVSMANTEIHRVKK